MLTKYFVMGGEGLLGSSVIRLLKKKKETYKIITKKNYNIYKNKKCSVLINMNGNSSKYIANTFPKYDFYKSVMTVLNSIFDFKYNKYIYISSGDVYEKLNKTSESLKINCPRNFYGKNKFLSELIVKFYCKNWLILRPGSIIGINAKKGLIFDLIKNKKVYSNINSSYSYLSSDTFAKILLRISKKNNQIYNISGNGTINNKKLRKLIQSKSHFDNLKKIESYVLKNNKIEKILKKKLPKTINEINKMLQIKKI